MIPVYLVENGDKGSVNYIVVARLYISPARERHLLPVAQCLCKECINIAFQNMCNFVLGEIEDETHTLIATVDMEKISVFKVLDVARREALNYGVQEEGLAAALRVRFLEEFGDACDSMTLEQL